MTTKPRTCRVVFAEYVLRPKGAKGTRPRPGSHYSVTVVGEAPRVVAREVAAFLRARGYSLRGHSKLVEDAP